MKLAIWKTVYRVQTVLVKKQFLLFSGEKKKEQHLNKSKQDYRVNTFHMLAPLRISCFTQKWAYLSLIEGCIIQKRQMCTTRLKIRRKPQKMF